MFRYKWMVSLVLLVALALSACSPIPPPHPGSVPDQILFIGSSLTYWQRGLDYHLAHLASAVHPPLKLDAEAVTIPEASLQQLWDDGKALDAIRTGNWDVVVLQVSSSNVLLSEMIPEYVRKFDEEIQQAGARTVLYISGRPGAKVEDIAWDYNAVAEEVGANVAPVNVAWQRTIAAYPDLQLHDGDLVHPSILGMYLATAVLYATIFSKSPEGLPYLPADSLPDSDLLNYARQQWQMTPEERDLLQRIAWETVKEYQVQQGAIE